MSGLNAMGSRWRVVPAGLMFGLLLFMSACSRSQPSVNDSPRSKASPERAYWVPPGEKSSASEPYRAPSSARTSATPTRPAPEEAAAPGRAGEGALPKSSPIDRRLRVLFIGNSLTRGSHATPEILDELVNSAKVPDPDIQFVANSGQSLAGHLKSRHAMTEVKRGPWDVVVLQERSSVPLSKREEFAKALVEFIEHVKQHSPKARVLVFETWAYPPPEPDKPNSTKKFAQNQLKLRTVYSEVVEQYVPSHVEFDGDLSVEVAPIGDAWEAHLAEPDPLMLYGKDKFHPGLRGRYLCALVFYGLIFKASPIGLGPWQLAEDDARRLQETADRFLNNLKK